ncbi:MAG TPA: hypothetical protein VEA99_01035, partial [Gemmatimonadaceae bacterium]|nr:hypothetical protein [Gemmatimonadaceae bacterium]
MQFELWWPFAFVIAVVGIKGVQTVAMAMIQRRGGRGDEASAALEARLARMEQAIDATALEVE